MTERRRGRLPDFLVVGAMRSGTTSLHRYLGAHPQISMVPKELQFFTERYQEGLDWYRAQFSEMDPVRKFGEATADYLARDSAMNRIAEILPDVRLIASLRDPVERAWSHYGLIRARGREPRSFEAALDDEMAAISQRGPAGRGIIYLYHGLYDIHLERAYRLFARDQVHVSIFERMVVNPQHAFGAICEFVGVDGSLLPDGLGKPVNPYVTFRSLRVRQISHRLPGPAARVLARLNTRRHVQRPQLDEPIRQRLQEFFAPRIRRLESILGYEIPEWAG